jgi:hypothetical protein
MSTAALEITTNPGTVWRVGFAPDPWVWADWKYAQDDGRFGGRWDDQQAQFRTIYTADSLYACLVELLAKLRPAPDVEADIMNIDDPDDQTNLYTDYPAGTINFTWFERRIAGSATQAGRYCYVTHSRSIATLRPHFIAEHFGLTGVDVDAALLKDAEVRTLTRSIARWLYEQTDSATGDDLVDGIEFRSRHGDDLQMWAVFERPDDGDTSPLFTDFQTAPLAPDTPALEHALRLHGISLTD